MPAVGAEKPGEIVSIQNKLNRLLEYPALANATLDSIDEARLSGKVLEHRMHVAPATRIISGDSAPRTSPS